MIISILMKNCNDQYISIYQKLHLQFKFLSNIFYFYTFIQLCKRWHVLKYTTGNAQNWIYHSKNNSNFSSISVIELFNQPVLTSNSRNDTLQTIRGKTMLTVWQLWNDWWFHLHPPVALIVLLFLHVIDPLIKVIRQIDKESGCEYFNP